MRSDGGYEVIKKAIEKLGLRHKEHIAAYGEGNERRLTGRHETADINTFVWVSFYNLWSLIKCSSRESPHPFPCCDLQGVANRGASIRVGRDTEKAGKGDNHSSKLNSLTSVEFFLSFQIIIHYC